MLLHFIFVVEEGDVEARRQEFGYVEEMAKFFGRWTREKFSRRFEIRSDIMAARPRGVLRRLDTHALVDDHRSRGEGVYHFYLAHFRPMWTDCTCDGYHAENFGMVWWQRPGSGGDELFLAEKNCTVVSHEIAHEVLRQNGVGRFVPLVHDVWTRHFHAGLEFERYGADFGPSAGRPKFMTIDTAGLPDGR